jgi:hypothetical protein
MSLIMMVYLFGSCVAYMVREHAACQPQGMPSVG